ncbi:hypothetical protein [Blastococcus litoris]|uniref:hypothetical protein n=1 Tax=Blastococcus litoris TaxID=2171622 RepID=UPI0013DEDABF|nr:hypothetical protein [Blastococcus litoris]
MSSTRRRPTRIRRGPVAGVALVVTLGVAGCSGPAAVDPSALTAEDLDGIREQVDALEDRVTDVEDRLSALEDPPDDGGPGGPGAEPGVPGGDDTFFGDPRSFLGQEIAVRGEVTEVLSSSDVASAFRVTGDVGEPVAVVSATPPPGVATGDLVEVTGTAVEVDPDTFEADFGIAADELFPSPETWLAQAEGEVAVAATRIEVGEAPAGD